MKRLVLALVSLGLFAVPLAVKAQPAGILYRIGLLGTSSPSGPGAAPLWEALLQGLRELVGKQLELLKAVPCVVRVTILWNPSSQTHPRMLNEADAAGRALGFRVQRAPARAPDDFERAFAAMAQARPQALLVRGDPIFGFHRTRIAELATTNSLPTIFVLREHAEAGGLMSYGANLRDNFQRAATYVDKILKGAQSVLLRADEVIQ
jgi:putative ABC transport system substrate-binding protein